MLTAMTRDSSFRRLRTLWPLKRFGVLGVVKEGREICDLKDCAEDPLVVEAEEVRLLPLSSWFCKTLGETCNKSSSSSW
ncbi:hypothetical protein E2C01_020437 [Portunus trituberculatus]|uniref:Uncharacterized protein n=1 Tax=Portunus trituberculatus TaxID=210409 RepID=A0A5B7E1H9_PORTR|nr:hypothetical protein [Portunus trituberculatus]